MLFLCNFWKVKNILLNFNLIVERRANTLDLLFGVAIEKADRIGVPFKRDLLTEHDYQIANVLYFLHMQQEFRFIFK